MREKVCPSKLITIPNIPIGYHSKARGYSFKRFTVTKPLGSSYAHRRLVLDERRRDSPSLLKKWDLNPEKMKKAQFCPVEDIARDHGFSYAMFADDAHVYYHEITRQHLRLIKLRIVSVISRDEW